MATKTTTAENEGVTTPEPVAEKDAAALEKEYQETKRVPKGYTRRWVTQNGETTPLYEKR